MKDGEAAEEAGDHQDPGEAISLRPWSSNVSGNYVVVASRPKLLEGAVVARGDFATTTDTVTGRDEAVDVSSYGGPPANEHESVERLC